MAPLRLLCDEHVGKQQFLPKLDNICYTRHLLDEKTLGAGSDDKEIWKFAVDQSLTVFTADTDFIPPASANPQNGTYPGVIFYDDEVSIDRIVKAVEAIEQQWSTTGIEKFHKNYGKIVFTPGSWA